ncbi:MAG: helix-hairpin-helix domain-containing protein, partial [Promethearchaeota archaeon]
RGYFIPYNPNQVFQLLGRAGRPGLDLTGEGIILTNNKEEYEWILDYYFQGKGEDGNLVPKYKPIISSFNKIGALREEVLLLSYLYNGITIGQLKNFFRNSFFAFNYKGNIGLEYFLLLKNINTKVLLKIHSDSIKEESPQVNQQHRRRNLGVQRSDNRKDTPRLKTKNYAPKLTNLKILQLHADHVEIAFKFDKYYSVTFDTNKGVMCSCGFIVNAERLSETDDVQNDYNFCKHIIALLQFLVYKINPINQKILTYLDDIIPYALKNERIIDFLIREGFLIEKEGKFYPTSLGALTIQLYIRPIEMINLRRILSTPNSLKSPTELLRETYDIVAAEKRYQDEIYFKALLMWINEIDIERIVNLSEKISAGEFFNFKDEVIRKLSYIEGVAAFYGKDEIAELAETLQIRITHGIKEELFDLVLRIKGVGRTRGRTLYNAGFHSVMDLIKSSPQEIHQKSGLNQKTCHKIWQSLQEIKKKLL